MTDYFETKSQPITRWMVIQAYRKVKFNKGSSGIDKMSWEDLEKDQSKQLYKLWNRLSSGSYFPQPVKEVIIEKKDGGERKLGVPTILDRIAQEVVKAHLERTVEPLFHESSYGYRPQRNCHMAVSMAMRKAMNHDWVIDIDIKSFFDTINHELLMKAVRHYNKEKWVLLYVERWLASGIIKRDGSFVERLNGTPQGGVISPLLANIFLHVVFDNWMKINHPQKPFERYADDIIVHCKTERQANYMLQQIRVRMENCKLELHPVKTKVVNLRGTSEKKYPRSLDFLGFTLKPYWSKTTKGYKIMPTTFISASSVSRIMEKFKAMEIHKWRKPIEEIAKVLNPIITGVKQYYGKFWTGHMRYLWRQLNERLFKWVKWEKGLYKMAAIRWLQARHKRNPNLFSHWELVSP